MLVPFTRPSKSSLGRGATAAALALVAGLAILVGSGAARSVDSTPSQTKRPSISGTSEVGATLTVSNGSWSNSPTSFSYQWLRCDAQGTLKCTAISGATSKQYRVVSADVGHTLRAEVTARNSAGRGATPSYATPVVRVAPVAPVDSPRPSISGSTSVGSTLTLGRGIWTGTQPVTIADEWQRCDADGNNCTSIAGATGTTYNLVQADLGFTLRVKETASNAKGSSSARSATTSVVTPAKGGAIPVALVSPPQRLVVDRVVFSPNPLGSRRPLVARFHVVDTRGFAVEGALVYALGLPYDWVRGVAEVATDGSGWATVTLRPTSSLPLRRGTSLVVFVRARKPGDDLLAGVSTRRLVQASVR